MPTKASRRSTLPYAALSRAARVELRIPVTASSSASALPGTRRVPSASELDEVEDRRIVPVEPGREPLGGLTGDVDERCLRREAVGAPQVVVRRDAMIATACDVDRGKIAHAGEAVGVHDRRPTDGGVGDPRLWYLEQDAAQRVVDLLVVLVLAF